MAKMLTRRGAHMRFDSRGEARLYERLDEKLEDDYLVWYNAAIGVRQLHPDFIILHPDRGLLVLEVKDWRLEQLHEIDTERFSVLTDAGLKHFANPLQQARQYVLEIVRLLQDDAQLQQPADSRHAGKLAMPWAYGVVLTNISRTQFEQAELDRVIPGHLVICQDEMLPSVDAENFQQCLWTMFVRSFPCRLSLPQIDRIRGLIFPDLRVQQGSLFPPAGAPEHMETLPDLMRVMDMQQEQLARSLGGGHRVIHGVAGSGKTMILGYRCVQMATMLHKPILVLCYNRTLAARLDAMLAERGLSERVHVRNFHLWCNEMLRTYHIKPAQVEDAHAAAVQAVMEGMARGDIPRGQYGALMVDEGHDFQPQWYQLVVQMVDPASNSVLILYDDAQNIYGKKERRKFSWKSVGIEAAGRTTILRLNYRNTLEVLSVARSFADNVLADSQSDEDGIPRIQPESAGRRGPMPTLLRCRDRWEEMRQMIAGLHEAHDHGHAWGEMAVLCHSTCQFPGVKAALQKAGIPCHVAETAKDKDGLFQSGDCVRVLTMHSSKGLEFPVVMIPWLDGMYPGKDEREAENQVKVLYVAMTRATERLGLFHQKQTDFTQRLHHAIVQAQARLA